MGSWTPLKLHPNWPKSKTYTCRRCHETFRGYGSFRDVRRYDLICPRSPRPKHIGAGPIVEAGAASPENLGPPIQPSPSPPRVTPTPLPPQVLAWLPSEASPHSPLPPLDQASNVTAAGSASLSLPPPDDQPLDLSAGSPHTLPPSDVQAYSGVPHAPLILPLPAASPLRPGAGASQFSPYSGLRRESPFPAWALLLVLPSTSGSTAPWAHTTALSDIDANQGPPALTDSPLDLMPQPILLERRVSQLLDGEYHVVTSPSCADDRLG
ncbi:hypothetical protein JTE90_021699 [Oedothorax gibbosus]|uniref:Uncharacterized protein n=1 Tax=Oedothorax gibbosus TaxID=931172 RepID=A0AAV6TRF6_9ARAC|nr:hypothetical protein JTE90_021699 [Oedothorax gibbosus]